MKYRFFWNNNYILELSASLQREGLGADRVLAPMVLGSGNSQG